MSFYAFASLVSMAVMSVAFVFLVLAIIIESKGVRKFSTEWTFQCQSKEWKKYFSASFFIILSCVFSLVGARWFPLILSGALSEKVLQVHWLKDLSKMVYFIFPFLFYLGWKRLSFVERRGVLKFWIYSFGFLSFFGIFQFFIGWPRFHPNPVLPGFFHPILFLGHHLSVGSIWIFPFFSILELFINSFFGKSQFLEKIGISKTLAALFIVSGFLVLIFSCSRTLWIALPIGIGIFSVLKFKSRKIWILLFLMLVLFGSFSQVSQVKQRLLTNMGVGDRIELWKANVHFFLKRPFLGVGFRKNLDLVDPYFQTLYHEQKSFFIGHAHNLYLDILSGIGIIGMLSWFFWVKLQFSFLIKQIKFPVRDTFSTGIFCAWIVFLINGLTQVNFWEGKVLHQLMWVAGMVQFWNCFLNEQKKEGSLW